MHHQKRKMPDWGMPSSSVATGHSVCRSRVFRSILYMVVPASELIFCDRMALLIDLWYSSQHPPFLRPQLNSSQECIHPRASVPCLRGVSYHLHGETRSLAANDGFDIPRYWYWLLHRTWNDTILE